MYFKKGDYIRSKKVCEIGLKKNPNSSVGYYILAKISLIDENLKKAEQYLEKSINYNSINLSAKNLLFFVHKELNRSKIKIKKNVLSILLLDPDNYDSNEWLNKNYKNELLQNEEKSNKKQKKIIIKTKNSDKKVFNQEREDEKEAEIIDTKKTEVEIKNELASMTLFNIYKSQGYYDQALQVLNVLKKNDKTNKQINKEISILKDLMYENK